MIGSVKVAMNFGALTSDGAAYENPIQRADDEVGADALVAEATVVAGFAQARDHRGMPVHRIQVAGQDHWRMGGIPLRIHQYFLNLQKPAMLGAAALQMQVVNHQRLRVWLSRIIQFVHQSDPSAFPPLQHRKRRDQQRARLPETGLMREPQDARRTNREGGEDGLAMIGGTFRGALAQLPKLGGERIVHAEGFGQVLGDIFAMRAPGAQVHFLKYAKVRAGFADCSHDAGEMFAAVDVPVEKSCAGAWRSRASVRSGVDNFQRIDWRGRGGPSQGDGERQDGRRVTDHLDFSAPVFQTLQREGKWYGLWFILEGSYSPIKIPNIEEDRPDTLEFA